MSRHEELERILAARLALEDARILDRNKRLTEYNTLLNAVAIRTGRTCEEVHQAIWPRYLAYRTGSKKRDDTLSRRVLQG